MPTWFARVTVGLGPPGFSENAVLLREQGHAPVKLWAAFDGAYAVHSRVGVGVWAGLSRGASRHAGSAYGIYPSGASLNEVGYYVAAQAPVRVWGDRDLALELVPRVGYAAGRLSWNLEADESDSPSVSGSSREARRLEAPMQHTAIFGAAVTLTSYAYHLGLDTGLVFAPVGAPGELGQSHDFGGFYFAFGGTIDG